MSTLSVATIKSASSAAPVFQNSSGTEKGQLVKVWAQIDGTGTVGTRDNFNVSSIGDQGTGHYRVNFANSMSNNNYCATASGSQGSYGSGSHLDGVEVTNYASGSIDLYCSGSTSDPSGRDDFEQVSVTVIGAN